MSEKKEERLQFHGYESLPSITFARSTELRFNCGDKEVLLFNSDGDVFVNGEKVDSNLEVYHAMLAFLGIPLPSDKPNLAVTSDEKEKGE